MYIPNTKLMACRDADAHLAILRIAGAEALWDQFKAHNASYHAPYHNWIHARNMVCDVTYLAGLDTSLITAALFHDMNHSAGRDLDDMNIEAALSFLHKWVFFSPAFPQERVGEIENLIRCTEFRDGVFPIEPNTENEGAIRDADLCSIFHIFEPHGHNQMFGLWREMITSSIGLDWKASEFIDNTEKFLRAATFYTERGQDLQANYLDLCLEELRKGWAPLKDFTGHDLVKGSERGFAP